MAARMASIVVRPASRVGIVEDKRREGGEGERRSRRRGRDLASMDGVGGEAGVGVGLAACTWAWRVVETGKEKEEESSSSSFSFSPRRARAQVGSARPSRSFRSFSLAGELCLMGIQEVALVHPNPGEARGF